MKVLKLIKENVRDEYWYYAAVEIEGRGIAEFRFPAYYIYENVKGLADETKLHEYLSRQATSILNYENLSRAA